jgi:hypothetical protein
VETCPHLIFVLDRVFLLGRFDVGCHACHVVVAGLCCDEETAQRWASDQRCAESTTTGRRPWP